MWIGGKRKDNQFKWTDGSTSTWSYTNWYPGEPSNDKGYDCVGTNYPLEGGWRTYKCYFKNPSVCQQSRIKGAPEKPPKPRPTTPFPSVPYPTLTNSAPSLPNPVPAVPIPSETDFADSTGTIFDLAVCKRIIRKKEDIDQFESCCNVRLVDY